MGKKLTYEFVKNEFLINNCELLETEYINNSTKMKYKCKCNNLSEINYNSFKKGRRCMKCSGSEKYTYKFVKNEFLINNCELLETKYINKHTKMKYKCKCKNISYITFSNFSNSHRCMKCSGKEKYTYDYVFQYFKDNNCQLLETKYIGCTSKLNYICENNHNTFTTFTKFLVGYRCIKCSGSEKHSFEYVYQYFKNNNLELLETEYKNCMYKLNYLCKNSHSSSISLNSLQKGVGCGKCKNKTEQMILEYLENNYQNIIFQPVFDWCTKKNKLPFDFLLNDFKIILEIDGRQHFSQVSNWKSPDYNLKNDIYKSNLAINNGYKIIRIFQEDVFNNKFDWKKLLKYSIKILNNTDEYIIYLSTCNKLYNKHKFELTKKILEDKINFL
jgi:very-short-patch-repair endonuclease